LAKDGLGDRGDLGDPGIDRGAFPEEDFDDAHAGVGIGLDVLDVVDRGTQGPFVAVQDPLFDFLGIETGVLPDDRDHRDIDGRKDVGGRPEQDERAEQDQHKGGHHEGVRASESEAYDPHGPQVLGRPREGAATGGAGFKEKGG
jgi:hypothetical protein